MSVTQPSLASEPKSGIDVRATHTSGEHAPGSGGLQLNRHKQWTGALHEITGPAAEQQLRQGAAT
jgi:hypothetical protein